MKIAVYSTKQYDKKYLQHVNDTYGFELEFFDFLLTEKTAKTANGCEAVCIFVNDDGSLNFRTDTGETIRRYSGDLEI